MWKIILKKEIAVIYNDDIWFSLYRSLVITMMSCQILKFSLDWLCCSTVSVPVQCDQQWFFLLELYLSTNIWFVDRTVTDSSLRYSISVISIPFFPPEIPFIPQWIVMNVFLAAYHWDHSASLDWKLWAKLVNIWTPQGCCVRPQSMEWCGDTSLYFWS